MPQSVENSPESSKIFNISPEGFLSVNAAGLSLDQLFILECLYYDPSAENHFIGDFKAMSNLQTLVRKEYLTEDNKITLLGIALLTSILDKRPAQAVISGLKKLNHDAFETWWKLYPPSDIFEYKGLKFNGSRAFRVKKEDCRTKFARILNEGEYTSEDLIRALEYEIHVKKEASLREKENKLKFMQNSLTYLNQRTFEGFIELSKTKPKTETKGGSVDI